MQQDFSDKLFGLLDILLTLDSSVVGYIHLIFPVKFGRKNSNVTYFDTMIQNPDMNYRGVSSGKDLREKLIKVEENHSPVKMKKIKRKINYKDNSKIHIEIIKTQS